MPPTRAVDLIAHRFAADLVGGFETVPPYLSNIPQNLFTKADVHQVPFIALAYGMLSVRRATRDRVRNSKDLSSVLEPKTQDHHTEQKSADALNPSMVDEGQGRELKQKGKAKESNESSLAAVVGSSVDKVANEATEKVQGQDYVEAVAAETKKRVGQSDGTDDGQNLNRTFTDREGIQCPYHGAGYALGGGEFEVHFNPPRDDPYVLELIERTKIRFERGRTPSNWGLDSTKDPLPQKKKRNKRRKAPQPESGNIDIEEGKDIAGASNGKLKAGDRNSGQPLFGRGKPATSAIDTVQKGDKTAIARSQLTTMASASSTSDAPTVNSAVCRQSDIPTTVGEGAGSSSSRGSSSADNIKAIKRKSVGSGSKAGKRKSGVSQGGSSGGGGQERSIGDSGDPGDKDKGKGKATAVDPRNAARKEKMEKEGLIAFKDAELRMKHGCETVYSSGVNPHLDHPNHHREWTATNLWCGRCTDFCALCCAPCCAHNGALLASYSSVNSVDEKKKAQNILAAIEKWNPIGKEETTFLTCNDCNSLVCPNCCGVCPHPVCRDLICKKCKPDPWALCDWHAQ